MSAAGAAATTATTATLSAYIAITAILVVTPGMGTALLMSTVLHDGRRAGYFAALGLNLGAATHAVIALGARAVLLRRAPRALTVLAVAGGCYLVWLGARRLAGIAREWRAGGVRPPAAQSAGSFARGYTTALLNAPIPVFYLVIVPQYIPAGEPATQWAALLSAIHLVMALAWMGIFVTLLGALVDALHRPAVRMGLDLATAILLVALGMRGLVTAL